MPGRAGPAAAYAIFLLSGAASLGCQVVWFKQLQFVLSSSTYAVSVVVASFFAGLALGSYALGRLGDRVSAPGRVYAGLELLLGVLSFGVTLWLSRWEAWLPLVAGAQVSSPAAERLVVVLSSLVVLLPPTVLMGATLPVLSRHLVARRDHLGQRIGTLYALNTLGAAVGTWVVGFVLIERLGVRGTGLVASAVYILIAVAAALAFWRRPEEAAAAPPDPSPAPTVSAAAAAPAAPASEARRALVLMAVFGASGFCSIAYEVVWFRVLAWSSYPTVYAFSAMLATYLLGLVIGTLICARRLARRRQRLLQDFADTQLFLALAALVSLGLLGLGGDLIAWLQNLYRLTGLAGVLSSGQRNTLSLQLVAMVTLVGPTTLIGLTFPLAAELTVDRVQVLGTRLGNLYALNTLGGVLGALAAGFLLLPLAGSQGTIAIIAGLNVVLYGVIVLSQDGLGPPAALLKRGALVAGTAVLLFVILGPGYLRQAQSHIPEARTLAHRESAHGTFVVVEHSRPVETGGPPARYLQLMVNGTSYASTVPFGRRYHAALGHLPALLHPRPRRALVICVGTGTTVGALTLHPEVEQIDAVDIAPEVFELAPLFAATNHGLADHPRVRRVVADGRHLLATRQDRYDLMTFEPPPPLAAGVVNLYSEEFYRLARRRLNPGGVLTQWFPLNHGSATLARINLATLLAVFPHVLLFIPNDMEAVAVASATPIRVDPAQLAARTARPALAAELVELGLPTSEALLATFVAGEEGLRRFTGDVPLVTDDQPRIEYHARYEGPHLRFDELLRFRAPPDSWLTGPAGDPGRLAREQQLMDHLWRAYELRGDGTEAGFVASRARLQAARALAPDNVFVRDELWRVAKLRREKPAAATP